MVIICISDAYYGHSLFYPDSGSITHRAGEITEGCLAEASSEPAL